MRTGLLALNGGLAIASIFFGTQIWRSLEKPAAVQRPPVRAATAGATPVRGPGQAPAAARPPLASWAVIGAKSLFSPARTEGPGGLSGLAQTGPRPFLYGVVVGADLSIAYLEDPGSKRVTGYRIGDAVAGGTVAAIAPDHVVLKRAEGMVDVQLRDPAKPRGAGPEAPGPPGTRPAAVPEAPGVLPQQPMPGPSPGAPMPAASAVPGAFPQPPTLLRRLPTPPPRARPDASNQ